MKALLRKDLREVAWLAVPIAIAWAAWWHMERPGERLVTSRGFQPETLASLSVTIGVVLGFLPFEIERLREMTAYLLHRGLSARQVAGTKVAASLAWMVGILAIGLAFAAADSLVPALVVPGYSIAALRVLALTFAIALPALALGAFVGTWNVPAWQRWLALLVLGNGLLHLAARATSARLTESPLGTLSYQLLCAALVAVATWLTVERFASDACEDRRRPGPLRWASGGLVLFLVAPVVLSGLMTLQYHARAYAWHRNDFWVQTGRGTLEPRPLSDRLEDPPGANRRGSSTGHGDWAYVSEEEAVAFHPIAGLKRFSSRMLGDAQDVLAERPWSFGAPRSPFRSLTSIDDWRVWFDPSLRSIVSCRYDERGRLRFMTLPLDPEREDVRILAADTPWGADTPGSRGAVLLVDAGGSAWGSLLRWPNDVEFRTAELPESDRIVEILHAGSLTFAVDAPAWAAHAGIVLVGEVGAYAYRDGRMLEVSDYESFPRREDRRSRVAVRVEDYDGLRYGVTLLDEDDGRLLASARVAPRTLTERAASFVAIALTLARPPFASIAAFALPQHDDDGSATPAASLWLDPLVFGGRRPWLVALNQGLALTLAWLARRRLGGRAWGWPLAIVALGVAAWLVCRVLEPRRMAPRVREEPRGVPAWAPIADRAGV